MRIVPSGGATPTPSYTAPAGVLTVDQLAAQRAQNNVDAQTAGIATEQQTSAPYEQQGTFAMGLSKAIVDMIHQIGVERGLAAGQQQGAYDAAGSGSVASTGGDVATAPAPVTGHIQDTAQAYGDAATGSALIYGQQLLGKQRMALSDRQTQIDKIKSSLPMLADQYGDKIRSTRQTAAQLKINNRIAEADVEYKKSLLNVRSQDLANRLVIAQKKLQAGNMNAAADRTLRKQIADMQQQLGLDRNATATQRANAYGRNVDSQIKARTWTQQHPTAQTASKQPEEIVPKLVASLVGKSTDQYSWLVRVDTGNKDAQGNPVFTKVKQYGAEPPKTGALPNSIVPPTDIRQKYSAGLKLLQGANRKYGWHYSQKDLIALWRHSLGMD